MFYIISVVLLIVAIFAGLALTLKVDHSLDMSDQTAQGREQ